MPSLADSLQGTPRAHGVVGGGVGVHETIVVRSGYCNVALCPRDGVCGRRSRTRTGQQREQHLCVGLGAEEALCANTMSI